MTRCCGDHELGFRRSRTDLAAGAGLLGSRDDLVLDSEIVERFALT